MQVKHSSVMCGEWKAVVFMRSYGLLKLGKMLEKGGVHASPR